MGWKWRVRRNAESRITPWLHVEPQDRGQMGGGRVRSSFGTYYVSDIYLRGEL